MAGLHVAPEASLSFSSLPSVSSPLSSTLSLTAPNDLLPPLLPPSSSLPLRSLNPHPPNLSNNASSSSSIIASPQFPIFRSSPFKPLMVVDSAASSQSILIHSDGVVDESFSNLESVEDNILKKLVVQGPIDRVLKSDNANSGILESALPNERSPRSVVLACSSQDACQPEDKVDLGAFATEHPTSPKKTPRQVSWLEVVQRDTLGAEDGSLPMGSSISDSRVSSPKVVEEHMSPSCKLALIVDLETNAPQLSRSAEFLLGRGHELDGSPPECDEATQKEANSKPVVLSAGRIGAGTATNAIEGFSQNKQNANMNSLAEDGSHTKVLFDIPQDSGQGTFSTPFIDSRACGSLPSSSSGEAQKSSKKNGDLGEPTVLATLPVRIMMAFSALPGMPQQVGILV
ncbi:hypothetical protein Nepgr_018807 [Nepenthes gracilis]|uniref:Uncharacterized protein n=1 Tax=Nepenthes gracilis TaxID=150966 RepID=A0AAD3XUP1_NEPGR|nr:hypothetical protein Nepgr_018807 [Nepenthes gracilis]